MMLLNPLRSKLSPLEDRLGGARCPRHRLPLASVF